MRKYGYSYLRILFYVSVRYYFDALGLNSRRNSGGKNVPQIAMLNAHMIHVRIVPRPATVRMAKPTSVVNISAVT